MIFKNKLRYLFTFTFLVSLILFPLLKTASHSVYAMPAYYLSDWDWSSMTNGWGPVEKDMSVGDLDPRDGVTLRLNGISFAKGLGAHANSDITYTLPGPCLSFSATVGVDDEVEANMPPGRTRGSVIFQLYLSSDNIKWIRYAESPIMRSNSHNYDMGLNSSDLLSKRFLRLVVTDAGDGTEYDHADWANAQISCLTATSLSPTPTPSPFIYPTPPPPNPNWDNGLARTPPMGWNDWYRYMCDGVNEQVIRNMADALVSSGMKDAGYDYLNIDDCWQGARDPNGNITADPVKFPSGIPALAAYVHSRGLKLGIYTDAGPQTCWLHPGSLGYEQQDIDTYSSWGVDFVKVDWCYATQFDPATQYAIWRDALDDNARRTGRVMAFSICEWGDREPSIWGPNTGNMWRTTTDMQDNWDYITGIMDVNNDVGGSAEIGGWNDPDILQVGLGGMTTEEYRSVFSIWSLMAAPLLAGNDLTTMSPEIRDIFINPEVIAVDQDSLGIQGSIMKKLGNLEVWAKKERNPGERAVVLLNRSATSSDITLNFRDIGLSNGIAQIRNLWTRTDLGSFIDSFTAQNVPAHGVVMVKVSGTEPAPISGISYLSDWTWTAMHNFWGPAERDKSNGDRGEGDGGPITLNGRVYIRGLGVHAISDLRFNLNNSCSNLSSDIGIDDDVNSDGSVKFQVWGDNQMLYQSPIMTGDSPTRQINVNITGKNELRLVVVSGNTTSYSYDHADWANARITCN